MVTALGLPLLMVNGKFQSLGSMSVEDLETFIPYLTKCSINRAGAQVINGVPEWWSSTIQFKFPLKKPKGLSQIGYKRHLSSIVCRCYWYHKAQYILPFCAGIANHPESVYLINNEKDNTTSIFFTKSTTHVLKFSNENKNYDMQPKKVGKTRRRCLLSDLPKKFSYIPDIYLCENCDAEFSSHSEMVKHEKTCYILLDSDKESVENEKIPKREKCLKEIEILEHIKPKKEDALTEKKKFFSYLMLAPSTSKNSFHTQNASVNTNSRRLPYDDYMYYKNKKIEFSSMYGRNLLNARVNSDFKSRIQKSLLLNESYCCASLRPSRETKDHLSNQDFKVTWNRKPGRRVWTHQYCFNKRQKKSRYLTLKTGLNERSRKLLKQCKDLRVVLYRLNITS